MSFKPLPGGAATGHAIAGSPAQYFPRQNGTISPAVDAGEEVTRADGEVPTEADYRPLLRLRKIHRRTTPTDGIADDRSLRLETNRPDIGFHYSAAR